MIIEKLASVITIEAEDREEECFFDVFDLFQNPGISFSPDCALFSPPGGDIDEIDGVDVHSGGGIATMSGRIGFEQTRPGFVPLIGFDGDVLSEQCARFCSGWGSVPGYGLWVPVICLSMLA